MTRCLLATVLALTLIAPGCSRPDPVPAEPAPSDAAPIDRPDLIVVLLDSLRADALDRDVDGKAVMPRLRAWSQEAMVFTGAQASSASTPTSVSSLFTSLPVPAFQGGFFRGVPPGVPTLAELLAAAGYRCEAYSANPNCARRLGHARGFERFVEAFSDPSLATGQRIRDDHPARIVRPDVLLERVLADLGSGGPEPVFYYIHLLQPHAPYMPPEGHVRQFDRPGLAPTSLDLPTIAKHDRQGELPAEWLPTLKARYDAHSHWVDEQLGAFLSALDRHPRFSEAAIVVLSDHGEAFGEHGRILHNSTAFEEMIRIPLILRPPGRPEISERIDRPVDLIDVAPTLLGFAEVSRPAEFQGRDLLDAAVAESPGGRPLLSVATTGSRHVALRLGDLKLLRQAKNGQVLDLLFDLQADPAETRNLTDTRSELHGTMSRQLVDEIRRLRGLGIEPAPRVSPDDEQREILRSLGYVGG